MKSVTVTLESPFKIALGNSGTEADCTFVELQEPTAKVAGLCASIENSIKNGLIKLASQIKEMGAQDAASSNAGDALKGEDIMEMISTMEIDAEALFLKMRALFLKCALMGGEQAFTESRLDALSYRDMKRLVGEYIANFIMT